MYIVFLALTLTLMAALSVARRLVEPACPSCTAKSWNDQPAVLQCTRCGWSNVALVPVSAESRR
jgi:hypothetical protein